MEDGLLHPEKRRRRQQRGTSNEHAHRTSDAVLTLDPVNASAREQQTRPGDLTLLQTAGIPPASTARPPSAHAHKGDSSQTAPASSARPPHVHPVTAHTRGPSQAPLASSARPRRPLIADTETSLQVSSSGPARSYRPVTLHNQASSLIPPASSSRPSDLVMTHPVSARTGAALQVPPAILPGPQTAQAVTARTATALHALLPRVESTLVSREGATNRSILLGNTQMLLAGERSDGGPSNNSRVRGAREPSLATAPTPASRGPRGLSFRPEAAASSATGAQGSQSQLADSSHQGQQSDASPPRVVRETPAMSTAGPTSAPATRTPHGRGVSPGATVVVVPESKGREMKMRLNIGFMLEAKNRKHSKGDVVDFAKTLAKNYNKQDPRPVLGMSPTLRTGYGDTNHSKWSLALHNHCSTLQSPWGIRLLSPTFTVFPGSPWRKAVKLMWKYLLDHYNVTGNNCCDTRVHVSQRPVFNLQEATRIAQAVIVFEPAIEAMVPDRRGHRDVKSNWLHSDNFATLGKSRADSVLLLETNDRVDELGKVMQQSEDGFFAWNFEAMALEERRIEFRKPGISTTHRQVIGWADFTMSFIQASMQCPRERLLRVPSSVGGLRWFLDTYNVPWLKDECCYVPTIWRNIPADAMLEPRPVLDYLEESDILDKMQHLDGMIREDFRRIKEFARSAQDRTL